MPGWEKIEFKRRSLKRKETFNQFGKKVRFEPLQSIPKLRKLEPHSQDNDESRETLMWTENRELTDKTTEFVEEARDKGFSEEQALHILNYHNFDERLAQCDLEIYQPMRGLFSENDRGTIRSIVDTICERIESGKNRDLNQVLTQFPAHSIGELLDFYANNRLYVKKKTLKEKTKKVGVTKSTFSDFSKNLDYRKCGKLLKESYMRKMSNEEMNLSKILAMEKSALDKFLQCDQNSALSRIYLDQINDCLNKKPQDPSEEDQEDISAQLQTVLDSLQEIERWMSPVSEEELIRHKWDNMDVSLLLLGLRKFGPDFESLCQAIGTKTVAMVESFYRTFAAKYGLDQITVDSADD